ncbi:MAG: hypothetical protein HQ453_14285 [Actinobacteria bacterium]|nr:hypothetical protein [Actinomycetota bacterium]
MHLPGDRQRRTTESAGIQVMVDALRSPSPIRTRSPTYKDLAHAVFDELEVVVGAYSSTVPEVRTTVRPSRQRVPVRLFTATLRHASELLTPIEITRGYYGRREPVFRRRVSHCSVVG